MRILFISNFYPPYELGGYEQWCAEVADRLVSRGHELAILTSRYGISAGEEGISPQVTRTLHLQADIAYYRPADFFLKRSSQERANIRELRTVLDRFQPELVMIWGMWNLSNNIPYWAEKWMPGRVAYFISNYWPMDVDPHTAYWSLPTRKKNLDLLKRPLRALAMASLRSEGYPPALVFEHAVCCSRYVRDTLVKAGKLPDRAGVLFGGTDPAPFLRYSRLGDAFAPEADKPLRLLYFGRLIYDKGVHTAVEALGLLKQEGLADQVELTILGSGHPEYEMRLHQMVSKDKLGRQVNFVKQIPRGDIPEWLSKFDVFLFTSIWPEPMARSVMEAMAAGLMVIGSRVGGQTEMLIDGENALTFEPGDASMVASHIMQVSGSPELRLRLARSGQQMVLERFTLDRMVNEIESYLQGILRLQQTFDGKKQPSHDHF